MRFEPTALPGAWLVRPQPRVDERGSFARTFCAEQMALHGLLPRFVQGNLSTNRRRGTLRGLHFQAQPWGEVKLVRCLRGRMWDVLVDLRADSPTYRRHLSVELAADEPVQLYVPTGVAHGFLTLEDDTAVDYLMGEAYRPEAARGVRWDDPTFAVPWPFPPEVISDRDASWPDWEGP